MEATSTLEIEMQDEAATIFEYNQDSSAKVRQRKQNLELKSPQIRKRKTKIMTDISILNSKILPLVLKPEHTPELICDDIFTPQKFTEKFKFEP